MPATGAAHPSVLRTRACVFLGCKAFSVKDAGCRSTPHGTAWSCRSWDLELADWLFEGLALGYL